MTTEYQRNYSPERLHSPSRSSRFAGSPGTESRSPEVSLAVCPECHRHVKKFPGYGKSHFRGYDIVDDEYVENRRSEERTTSSFYQSGYNERGDLTQIRDGHSNECSQGDQHMLRGIVDNISDIGYQSQKGSPGRKPAKSGRKNQSCFDILNPEVEAARYQENVRPVRKQVDAANNQRSTTLNKNPDYRFQRKQATKNSNFQTSHDQKEFDIKRKGAVGAYDRKRDPILAGDRSEEEKFEGKRHYGTKALPSADYRKDNDRRSKFENIEAKARFLRQTENGDFQRESHLFHAECGDRRHQGPYMSGSSKPMRSTKHTPGEFEAKNLLNYDYGQGFREDETIAAKLTQIDLNDQRAEDDLPDRNLKSRSGKRMFQHRKGSNVTFGYK